MAQRTPLQRVRVGVEPAGSFAVDLTDTIGDLTDLRFNSAVLSRTTTVLQDEAVVQALHQRRVIHRGFKGATLDISGDLVPLSAAYDADATPAQDLLSKVLESMCATTATRAAGSTVEASPSPTTTGFSVAAGHGSRVESFRPVLVETTATSERYELNAIADGGVSTDALTFASAFSFTPASGAKVLNCELITPGTLAVASQTSLQFLVEGEDRDMIWLALGAQGPLAIEWPLGGHVRWSSQFMAANWLHDDEISTPQGGGALAVATLTGGTPVVANAGSIVLAPTGATTRVTPTIAELTMNLGMSWQPVDSFNGTQGKAQMAFVRGEQPTVSCLVLADDEGYVDAFAAGTTYRLLAQAGNTGAGTVGMYWPTLELIAEPTIEDRNGLAWWRLQFGAVVSSASVSPWYLARF